MNSGYMAERSSVTGSSAHTSTYSPFSLTGGFGSTNYMGNDYTTALNTSEIYFRSPETDFGSHVKVGSLCRKKVEMCNGTNDEVNLMKAIT